MNREKLGEYIKSHRQERQMTQKALAEAVGQSVSYVYDIEAGRRVNLSRDKFFKWADALRVDPEEFFEAAGELFPLPEKPERFIPLPYDFPEEAQVQVERFAKFLQHEKEFDQFLALSGYFDSEEALQESLDAFVRKTQTDFSISASAAKEGRGRGHSHERESHTS
jgi:transcriptional regulator with XRE-family HTH domain